MKKKKFYITTTIGSTLNFFRGQPRLWEEKFDVCALSAEKDRLSAFADEEGIRYKYLPLKREITLQHDLICLIQYVWIFLKDSPYVVHGNTPKASLLSMVAAWITRRPVRIYMCHGLRYQGTEGRLRKLLKTMEKISCTCATHVYSVSKGVANVMVTDGLCKKEKIHIVGYGSAGGVDIERFNANVVKSNVRKELEIAEDAFVFAFVGRIVKDKGVNELVAAIDKLGMNNKNVHLLLIGPTETLQNPIDKGTSKILDMNPNIHVVGVQKDVRPYLKASNAFVLPSYREGFGMVLIEAGAMGLPCITTNITGCNEIIVHGENGTIINARDTEALYQEMKRWVEQPEYVSQLAKNARKMVEERYECHKVWRLYYDEYKRLATV